jgi:hypothetical protein
MDVQLSATGTPAQVTTDLAQQLKSARDQNPGAWPTLGSLRDYVATLIAGFVDDASAKEAKKITVSVSCQVTVAPADEAKAKTEAMPEKSRRKKT